MTKKQVFQKIAKYFNVTAYVTVSGDQCLRKWTKLKQKYKEVEGNNKITGNGRKNWKFLDNMTTTTKAQKLIQHFHLMHQLNVRNPDLHPNQLTAALTMEIAQTQVVRKELKPRSGNCGNERAIRQPLKCSLSYRNIY